MTKQLTKRQQLQARVKQLKAEGKISKKFDARQSNVKLEAEINRVESRPGIVQPILKVITSSDKVVSFREAENYAARKGCVLEYSSCGFRLHLYVDSTGRPEKFLLPSDVVKYIDGLAA